MRHLSSVDDRPGRFLGTLNGKWARNGYWHARFMSAVTVGYAMA